MIILIILKKLFSYSHLYGKNDFAKRFKFWPDTNQKSNFVKLSK